MKGELNLKENNERKEAPKLPKEEPIKSIWIQKGGSSDNDREK